MKAKRHIRRLKIKIKAQYPILKLKHVMQKLQTIFLSLGGREYQCEQWDDRINMVKDGCFAVSTMNEKKFFVSLRYLGHPAFRKLLEETEREFGFGQPGVLVLPCQASELRRILSERICGE
ncbi:hypothetical protein ACHQM5_028493 [Ranunculus cassubicifolius]